MIDIIPRNPVDVLKPKLGIARPAWLPPMLSALVMLFLATGPAFPGDTPRVVLLGGSLTEIAYALHREDHIVGVDTTSVFPPEALKSKASVGYVRAVSAEGVLSLKPSLVIAIQGAGPADALKLIEATGTALRTVPDEASPAGVGAKIEAVGDALDARNAADALKAEVSARFAALALQRPKVAKPLRVLIVLSLQNGRSTVGGRGTAADGIIKLSGSLNAADAVEGYKTMTDESIIAAAPDVVLVMQNGGHALDAATVFALPAYSTTPAGLTRRLVAMDGLLLLGFGPRTPEAAGDLMRTLYPEAATP